MAKTKLILMDVVGDETLDQPIGINRIMHPTSKLSYGEFLSRAVTFVMVQCVKSGHPN